MRTPEQLYSPPRSVNTWMPERSTAKHVWSMSPPVMEKYLSFIKTLRTTTQSRRKSPQSPAPRPWVLTPRPDISSCPPAKTALWKCWFSLRSPESLLGEEGESCAPVVLFSLRTLTCCGSLDSGRPEPYRQTSSAVSRVIAFQRPRNLCSHPSAGNTKSLARLLRANNPLVSIDFPSILME